MKNITVKNFFLFMEKNVVDGSLTPITHTFCIAHENDVCKMLLENGEILCFKATEKPCPITSYWYESAPDKIIDGNFAFVTWKCLVKTDDEGKIRDVIATGTDIHLVVDIANGMYEVRQAHRLRTLCFVREKDILTLESVNSAYTRDKQKMFYRIEDKYYVLWFSDWRIQTVGEEIFQGVYNLSEMKTLYLFQLEYGITEIIPYRSLERRSSRLIVEVAPKKYRIFERKVPYAVEIKDESLALWTDKSKKMTIYHYDDGHYEKSAEEDDVLFRADNAFVKANQGQYFLYGLRGGKRFLIDAFSTTFEHDHKKLVFGKTKYRLKNEKLDYTPIKKKPWWKIW